MESARAPVPPRAYAILGVAYLAALTAAAAVVMLAKDAQHPLLTLLLAELAATVTVFAFSVANDNTAFFNPHWSLAPIAAGLWLALGPGAERGLDLRQVATLAVVTFYGVRLTFNWVRGWGGLGHEDWQYVDFRARTGRGFWPVSFLAFHLFPMALVVLGMLPLYPALVTGTGPMGALDWLALLITAGAIIIEWVADDQLRAFRRSAKDGEICTVGLWAWSRHPNYFGEVGFWFGLWLVGLAAGGAWWTAAGWLGMAGLFLGASIPMAEKRSLARRPGYAAHAARTSLFIPLPPRAGSR